MDKNFKSENLLNDKVDDNQSKTKLAVKVETIIRCKIDNSEFTINFIPKSIDDLKGMVCPQCGRDKFEIV